MELLENKNFFFSLFEMRSDSSPFLSECAHCGVQQWDWR
jgi:hypothetical protein